MVILKNGIEITKLISKNNFSIRYIMKLITFNKRNKPSHIYPNTDA